MRGKKTVGVVLAGGESRRFGEPKAFANFHGKTLFQHALDTLSPLTDEQLIVSHPQLKETFNRFTQVPVIEDVPAFQGMGPLAGIYSAMIAMPAEWYMILPCDAPLVPNAVFTYLLEHMGREKDALGAVPLVARQIQPLIAVYRKDLQLTIKDLLTRGKRRVDALFDEAPIGQIKMDGRFDPGLFANINTKAALQKLS